LLDSKQHYLFNIACIGQFIGPWVSECAQTSPSTIDYHVYLSGNKVIKAFTANDVTFNNKSGDLFILQNDKSVDIVKKVQITWKIWKNHRNGQAITLSAADDYLQLGPICAALQMVLLAQRLGQSDSLPVACRIFKKKRVYLTGKRVSTHFIEAAKSIHPNTLKDELSQYSTHSLQVWACVLLDKAGMSPKFIMSRL
jgi:ABC-type taurine transport system substrate-binding protein